MSTVERAFELAATSRYRTISDLEKQLKREGYASVAAHLNGSSIRKQLRGTIVKASEGCPSPESETVD